MGAREPFKVAMVGVSRPGYRSLGMAYTRAAAEAHPGVAGRAAFQTLELTDDLDPWWIAYRVLGLRPDMAAFSVFCWNGRAVYEACRVLHEADPSIRLVLGGPEVGPIAEELLAGHPSVFAVVRGEGEETFAELLVALMDGDDAHAVPGVSARDGGGIASAPDREPVDELDSIPSPILSGLLPPVHGGTYIETYRGCPHQCGYCYEAKGIRRIRHFSRERVKAEIDAVAGAPGVQTFSFIDSVFNLTDERLEWLAEVLEPHARRGVTLHTIEVDIERIDDDAAALLKRMGVASVETGPQTIGEAALEVCARNFDADKFRAGVEALKRADISVECDLIVGLPGDDIYDFLAGMRFAFDLDPGTVQTSSLHVLPGTRFWDDAQELGLVFDREPPHGVISTKHASYLDLRRAEIMSMSLQDIYKARV